MKKLFNKDTFALIIGSGSISLMIYLLHLQKYPFSLRASAYLFIIWLIFFIFSLTAWKRGLSRHFFRINLNMRRLLITVCLACGFLSLPSQIPLFFALLPARTMEVQVHQQDPSEKVVLEGFNNGILYISLNDLDHDGEWKRDGDTLIAWGEDVKLSWSGHTGESTYLIFQPSRVERIIELSWDGRREVIQTSGQETDPIFLYQSFDLPWVVKAASTLTFSLAYSFIFIALILLLASIHILPKHNTGLMRFSWLPLALPSVFIWTVYLLSFFPALMTLDSFYSWDQLFTHVYQDLHPVSYTIYLWLLTRMWYSPVAVGLFQVISMSLVIAGTLGYMMRHGLPVWAAWGISIIYAIFPINGLLVNSIWKDIPYSIALLGLFSIAMRIVMDRGSWLDKRTHLLLLGGFCAVAGLMRHNGIVVSAVLLFFLFLLYPGRRRAVLLSAFMFLATWGIVKGPVYRLLNVKTYAISGDQVLIYHIGAHIHAATPMQPDEVEFLNTIQTYPDWWQYNTCSINNILANGQFDADYYEANRSKGWKLFFSLLRRNPCVNIHHIYQSGAYLVKLERSACAPKIAFLREDKEGYIWISPDNSIQENSLLPNFVPVLYDLYLWISDFGILTMPAFYLYLTIVLILSFTLRTAEPRWLVLLAIPVIQSGVMYAANVSNEFRFQYAVVLICILCLALPFWNPDIGGTHGKHDQ